MNILGYGEDALTYWALTERTREFLDEWNDNAPLSDVKLMFRPSFGRQGSRSVQPGEMADSSQFGEFDSILGTPNRTYLVEAKWNRSSEIERAMIVLRPEQIRRHQIFRAYVNAWRNGNFASWDEFFRTCNGIIDAGGVHYPVAPIGSQLASNLQTVLQRVDGCGHEVRDVVLYVRIQNGRNVDGVQNADFDFVSIDCPSPNGFVELRYAEP